MPHLASYPSTKPRPWRTVTVLCALLSFGSLCWAQISAGKVMAATGTAKAVDAKGHERVLEKGADIYSGDKVVTAAGALVQIRLADGGYMSVRSGTEMVFDRFVYDDKDASKSNFLVSLVRGGFRSITGLIGRTNPGAYQIRTSTATVGIRGTDHEPMVIPDQPGMAALGAPGLYDKVNEGETFIQSKGGMLSLKRGDVGFSPLRAGGAPQILTKLPDFYKVDLKTDGRDPKDGAQEKPDDAAVRIAPASPLLRPTLAARREGLIPMDARVNQPPAATEQTMPRVGVMGVAPTLAPRNTLTPQTNLQLAPNATSITPINPLVAPTTTLITPTALPLAPTTNLTIAPTTLLVAPTPVPVSSTTMYVAPSTTLIAPTTTLIVPTTTTITPSTFTTTTTILR